jgi:hypothetical protein
MRRRGAAAPEAANGAARDDRPSITEHALSLNEVTERDDCRSGLM